MSDQYVAEIRAFGFNFPPVDWMLCNGQTLPISQYAALFSILGTTFGGNGTTTFQLPNLQGDVPMQWGTGAQSTYFLGQQTGTPNVALLITQMPNHMHTVQVAEGGAVTGTPGNTVWLGESSPATAYAATGTPSITLAANAIGMTGGSQPHQNMQPYLTVNFCIAISGIFPTRG